MSMTIHPTAKVHPSVILTGDITIGKRTIIEAGTVINGNVTIGEDCYLAHNITIRGGVTLGNLIHMYDNVCIEGGRGGFDERAKPKKEGEPEFSVIEDMAWINHGAVMHGCHVKKLGVLGLNACMDYGCILGEGAIVTNGSAVRYGTVIPDNSVYEGVPAKMVKENIQEQDRIDYMGLVTKDWLDFWYSTLDERLETK